MTKSASKTSLRKAGRLYRTRSSRLAAASWLKTKVKRGTVDPEQLRRHLKRIDGKHETEILLVPIPDETKPSYLTSFASDKRVAWASFNSLTNAIDELLAHERKVHFRSVCMPASINRRPCWANPKVSGMLACEQTIWLDPPSV